LYPKKSKFHKYTVRNNSIFLHEKLFRLGKKVVNC
jgi:hypothetical protein